MDVEFHTIIFPVSVPPSLTHSFSNNSTAFVSLKPKKSSHISLLHSIFSSNHMKLFYYSTDWFSSNNDHCFVIALLWLKTLLLYALISMAWWEGVDETRLLIAPGNYFPPSPPLDSVSITCLLNKQSRQHQITKEGK